VSSFKRLWAIALGVLTLTAGCGSGTSVYTANNEVSVTASITGIRRTKYGDTVAGFLKIEGNKRKLVSADLECFWLHVGATKSESIWVDTYIDTLRGDYPARDGVVTVGVYWAMPDDARLTAADLREAKLTIKNPFLTPSCFEFAKTR
jgi:hypothetical protein